MILVLDPGDIQLALLALNLDKPLLFCCPKEVSKTLEGRVLNMPALEHPSHLIIERRGYSRQLFPEAFLADLPESLVELLERLFPTFRWLHIAQPASFIPRTRERPIETAINASVIILSSTFLALRSTAIQFALQF